MEFILNILRFIRHLMYEISHITLFGFYVDNLLHFGVAFVLTLLLNVKFTFKRSAQIVIGLMFFKELVDLFAKSRLDYVRPPALDMLFDLSFGFLGVLSAYWVHHYLQKRKQKVKDEI